MLIEKAIQNLRTKGMLETMAISGRYISQGIKNIFFVQIPLKFELRNAKNGLVEKEIQGSRMLLDAHDVGISQELILRGVHEKNSTDYLKKVIKPGMVVVEVGANIGYYTLIETKLIGEKGKIYAFEPSPINMDTLKRNLELNNATSQVEIVQKGVGNKNAKEKFFLANKGNTSSFINRDDQSGVTVSDTIEVDVIKLDDFFKDKETKIDYLRMDVEGYEVEVIDGMKNLLASYKAPQGFFIEVHSELLHRRGSSAKKFIETLKYYKYDVIQSFYRGRTDISANSTEELLNHHWLEKGYWETFFRKSGQ